MKKDLHPDYMDCKVTCAFGHTFMTKATVPEIKTELCSKCHPFFTGEQVLVDTAGQVERFEKKMQVAQKYQAEQEKKKPKVVKKDPAEEKEETTEELLAKIKKQMLEDEKKKKAKKKKTTKKTEDKPKKDEK